MVGDDRRWVDEEAATESPDDGAAFTELFEQSFDDVYRYLAFRVGEVMAEDLAAETFARAFAGRRRFESDRGFGTCLAIWDRPEPDPRPSAT